MTPKICFIFATLLAAVVGAIAGPIPARSAPTYDALQGTLPQAQGWQLVEDISPPMAYPLGVTGGALHLSTVGFASSGLAGGGVWWQRSDMPVDFSGDFWAEVSVRIVSAPNHSINGASGSPRPGYALAVFDVQGRVFWIGLGSAEIFLSNTLFGQYGSSNTVTKAFNTTDAVHLYRIERASGGVGAALRIDGSIQLQLPALGVSENNGPLVYFGDPTYWANSESYTSQVRFGMGVVGVEPTSPSGALSARVVGSPTARPGVFFHSGEAGTLAFEIFDTTGRRVERAERDVIASESGTFLLGAGHHDGVYFYRLRLAPASGRASEASGRIVRVR